MRYGNKTKYIWITDLGRDTPGQLLNPKFWVLEEEFDSLQVYSHKVICLWRMSAIVLQSHHMPHVAAENGHSRIVKYFVDSTEVDINIQDHHKVNVFDFSNKYYC